MRGKGKLKALEDRQKYYPFYPDWSFRTVRRQINGRNAPCPCGSGKKFKKCCMNKPEEVK